MEGEAEGSTVIMHISVTLILGTHSMTPASSVRRGAVRLTFWRFSPYLAAQTQTSLAGRDWAWGAANINESEREKEKGGTGEETKVLQTTPQCPASPELAPLLASSQL